MENGQKVTYYQIPAHEHLWVEHDPSTTGQAGTKCTIGFGKYRIEFWWYNVYGVQDPDDYCTLEYDAGSSPTPAGFSEDVNLVFKYDGNGPRVEFNWLRNSVSPASHRLALLLQVQFRKTCIIFVVQGVILL